MRYLLLLSLVILASCGSSEKPAVQAADKKEEPIEVKVTAATERRVDKSILVTGSLLPDEKVTVSSEVQGRVSQINVDFGQFVRKGQILVELDKTEHQLQVDRSRAALAQALARVGLSANEADKEPTTTPNLRQALAQMEDVRFKYDNAKKLVESGDISRERFTELEKQLNSRVAVVEAARDEMRVLWASVEALKSEVGLAQKRLRDTTIRAPMDASVSERMVAPGQFIKDNTPLLTLVKTNPLRLRLEVPESGAGAVRMGTTLEFTTEAVANSKFSATVRELNPQLNEQSRTLIAEARLNNADARLRPGMFVQVRLILSRNSPIVVVPKQAIYTVAGLTKVFTVRDGKIVEHRIPPGQAVEQFVEVPADAVRSGDMVVTSNLAQLTNGQPVRIGS